MTCLLPVAWVVDWRPGYSSYCNEINVLCPHCDRVHLHIEGDGPSAPHCHLDERGHGQYMIAGTEAMRLHYELERRRFLGRRGPRKASKTKIDAQVYSALYNEVGWTLYPPNSDLRVLSRYIMRESSL